VVSRQNNNSSGGQFREITSHPPYIVKTNSSKMKIGRLDKLPSSKDGKSLNLIDSSNDI
jgi:hypothetical protein